MPSLDFTPYKKPLKICGAIGSAVLIAFYNVNQTRKKIDRIVNPNVLKIEQKPSAEYIYIDDPAFGLALKMEQDKEKQSSYSRLPISRLWKSLQYSVAWRLLWLCRHGNKEQRNIALEQLAAFKNHKPWDCIKIAQALDQNTAVLLARTSGADVRYFLPPPIHVRRAALTNDLLSFKLLEMITAIQNINPHTCIQHFLYKHLVNIQEQAVEVDSVPSKPDTISEHGLCLLCLDAIHHHLSLFQSNEYKDNYSLIKLVNMGLMECLAEMLLRYPKDTETDWAVVKVLTVASVHSELLQSCFNNGLIGNLCHMIKDKNLRISSSAAVSLANLSGEECYKPGLYLLHPIYRTKTAHTCDTVLIHGLRGGVFVTWRQRDKKCAEPIGLIEVTVSDVGCKPCDDKDDKDEKTFIDPELKQIIDDLDEFEEESLLADYDVVLHDLPIDAKRDVPANYSSIKKREGLNQEVQDNCRYTHCWPKDWLPEDCRDLRIIGVNYWSSLSEWFERCPWQTADIEVRASELAPDLIDAGVGKKEVPVVWLAHSMGGLIVKQVLIEASESDDSKLKALSDNTKAILFFSTPHKGSALATMSRAAAAVLWPSSDVRQLQENSPLLLDLHSKFIKYAEAYNWETISFAETMPTLVTAFKVPVHFVQASSADLGRGLFYQMPLDHLCICKPATRESLLYTTVLDVIQRVTKLNISDLTYSNQFLIWLMNIWWWIAKSSSNDVIDSLDETSTENNLLWMETLLFNVFSDF